MGWCGAPSEGHRERQSVRWGCGTTARDGASAQHVRSSFLACWLVLVPAQQRGAAGAWRLTLRLSVACVLRTERYGDWLGLCRAGNRPGNPNGSCHRATGDWAGASSPDLGALTHYILLQVCQSVGGGL